MRDPRAAALACLGIAPVLRLHAPGAARSRRRCRSGQIPRHRDRSLEARGSPPREDQPMKRKTLLILLVGRPAAGAASYWAWRRGGRREAARPLGRDRGARRRGRLARGRPRGEGARRRGRARWRPAQPIVQLETDLIDLQIQQQESRVAQAQANLDQDPARAARRGNRPGARATAQNAERERLRLTALLERGIIGQQAVRRGRDAGQDAAETLAASSSGATGPRTSPPRGRRSTRKSGSSAT